MRRAFHWLALGAIVSAGGSAAEPARKAMPIGGEWNLSGRMLERTQMDGKRVVQLTAKGEARLKQGRNPLLGPWTLEASAEIIECDFPGKRFIVHGPYSIRRKLPGGAATEISGAGPDSTAELTFHGGAIKAAGPNKIRLIEALADAPKARKVADPVAPDR
jgi:hypothetical protein